MEKEVLDFVVEKTKDLMKADTCSDEAKTAAQNWLNALGTEDELTETKSYIQELEEDLVPIDALIDLAESDTGVEIFGENAKNVAAHAKEIKDDGAKYCDCSACVATAAILEKKNILFTQKPSK